MPHPSHRRLTVVPPMRRTTTCRRPRGILAAIPPPRAYSAHSPPADTSRCAIRRRSCFQRTRSPTPSRGAGPRTTISTSNSGVWRPPLGSECGSIDDVIGTRQGTTRRNVVFFFLDSCIIFLRRWDGDFGRGRCNDEGRRVSNICERLGKCISNNMERGREKKGEVGPHPCTSRHLKYIERVMRDPSSARSRSNWRWDMDSPREVN
jgi:hypothetical protein